MCGLLNLSCCVAFSTATSQLQASLWGLGIEGVSLLWLLARAGLPELRCTQLTLLMTWLHVTWWWAPPVSSEDVWRYLWDGALWWQGASTYLSPPNAPVFDELSAHVEGLSGLRSKVGHEELTTIYPPGAQLLFRLSAGFESALTAWRVSLLGAQLLSFFALRLICKHLGRPLSLAALPLLIPVWVFDSASGAHLDAWGVSLGLWGVAFALGGYAGRAGFCLGAGLSVKLIPGLWGFVWLARHCVHREWRQLMWLIIGGLLALVCTCTSELPELLSLIDMTSATGVSAYQRAWVFNDSLFSLLVYCVESTAVRWLEPRALVQLTLMLTLLLTPFVNLRRAQSGAQPRGEATLKSVALCTALLLLGSPVVYSWYLGWLIVFLPVIWGRGALYRVTLTWALIIPITYLPRLSVLSGGPWEISAWWRVIEYLPLGLILAIRTRYTPHHLPRHILR